MSLTPVAAEDRLEEARWIAQEVAALLDIPYREPVFVENNLAGSFALMGQKSGLLRSMAERLDDEEFLFWVTYNSIGAYIGRDAAKERAKIPLEKQALFAVVTVLLFFPIFALKEVSIMLALLWPCMALPLYIRFLTRTFKPETNRLFHLPFEVAVQLTGLPDAGERMMRKAMETQDFLSRFSWIQNSRKSWVYELFVPPQYRKA